MTLSLFSRKKKSKKNFEKIWDDMSKFIESSSLQRFNLITDEHFFFDTDNMQQTNFDAHYIYHPAWATRIIKKINPSKHVDISSTLHFSTILSAFMPVEFYDYRPASLFLSNMKCDFADLTQLPFEDNSISSLSCMHTIEHIGLGRYGDTIDYDGDIKAISELKRVLAINGNLLFVVPIGEEAKIFFNAHRIYTYQQIITYFSELELMEFSLIRKPITDLKIRFLNFNVK